MPTERIYFLWFPGTWEVDALINENPSPTNFVGLGLWLVDKRFPDRLPLDVFEPIMMCPPDYTATFGPIPAGGANVFKAIRAQSYEESVLGAVGSAIKLIKSLPPSRKIILGGYSQGAEVAERVKGEFLPEGSLSDRKLLGIYTFGNPGRQEGVTFPNGNVLPWGGIAQLKIENPVGCLYRTYGFYDDMYANANPRSYLFDFYRSLTDLQFHNPFKAVRDGLANLSKTDLMIIMGAKPKDPMWIISHVPQFISIGTKAVNSIDAGIRFLKSGAHGHYHDWDIVPGQKPVFHCIRSMKYLAKGQGYAVAGL